jgi:hypothetical protein
MRREMPPTNCTFDTQPSGTSRAWISCSSKTGIKVVIYLKDYAAITPIANQIWY